MKASDVMTWPVITIQSDALVCDAAALMLEKKISGVPVVDHTGNLVGMLTESDFLRREEVGTGRQRPRWIEFFMGPGRLADEYVRSHSRKVGEVMTPDPVVVDEDVSLNDVVQLMEHHHIKRVPVVRQGQVVGIISRRNLVQALAEVMRRSVPRALNDDEIRTRILAELDKQSWAPVSLRVTVKDGEVDLDGLVTDERQRQALKVMAENTAGVKAVHDRLVWVDPMSGAILDSPGDAARDSDERPDMRTKL